MKKIAIVTGANRGLGLATGEALLKQDYEVIFASRAKNFTVQNKFAHNLPLDLSSLESIETFVRTVRERFSQVDVLINNGGIFIDSKKAQDIESSFRTNTLAPALLASAFLPTMLENNFGRIVNVSSGMGQLSEMAGGYLAYRVSKTGLNAVTRTLAAECTGKNVLINSVCPGWVRTDMGGSGADRTIPEGIMGIVWAANLPAGGPCGGFFRDGKPIAW